MAAGSKRAGKPDIEDSNPFGTPGVTVNKALAGRRKSATYLSTLTPSPVDRSTIRNTCRVMVEHRISTRPFAQAV
jgi:hypothetical protein